MASPAGRREQTTEFETYIPSEKKLDPRYFLGAAEPARARLGELSDAWCVRHGGLGTPPCIGPAGGCLWDFDGEFFTTTRGQ
jgi:hypothetical protein